MPHYDCIVLGVGGFGSAALYHAAARGLSVLGLERFGVAHDRGSSHGELRITRKVYFEHPDYVPLLLSAYDLWHQLEAETGRRLMRLCGLMLTGPADGEVVPGSRLAARTHSLPLEDLKSPGAKERLKLSLGGFVIPESFATVFEPDGGYLEVENCVRAHVEAAVRRGAALETDAVVEDWTAQGSEIRVRTSKGVHTAKSLVVTAGAWAAKLLQDLKLPLQVVRKPQFWFPVRSAAYDVDAGSPCFYFEMPYGHFYGFPSVDRQCMKVAEHTSRGEPVSDPLTVDRNLRPDDLGPLTRFVAECLPDLQPAPMRHSVCLYTLTPDRHFIVDRHPAHQNVAFGAGFSGHGFKFTSVIGQALVDLATEGRTRHPVGFLSAARETLTPGERAGERPA